jgi:hypothetical protein
MYRAVSFTLRRLSSLSVRRQRGADGEPQPLIDEIAKRLAIEITAQVVAEEVCHVVAAERALAGHVGSD